MATIQTNGANALKSNTDGLKPALHLAKQPDYPAKVFILAQYDGGKGRTAVEAVSEANERRVILLSNKLIDPRLNGEENLWRNETEIYPLWTGTLVIYTKPGEKLGAEVAYTDPDTNITYLFQIPKEYQNATNCILAINHEFDENGNPVFTYNQDGDKRFIVAVSDENNLQLIQNFPANDGWFKTESGLYIPVNDKKAEGPERYNRRIGKYVGLLARGYNNLLSLLDDYLQAGRLRLQAAVLPSRGAS